MLEKEVIIKSSAGLHARPASALVNKAGQFTSEITIVKAGQPVNAKSILGIMSLAVSQGDTVTIRVEGADEEAALAAIVDLIENTTD